MKRSFRQIAERPSKRSKPIATLGRIEMNARRGRPHEHRPQRVAYGIPLQLRRTEMFGEVVRRLLDFQGPMAIAVEP
jgi:hypothetical protein